MTTVTSVRAFLLFVGWIAVARFLDMPRRIAQERFPTASNVGSRDVTWASQPTPLIPFRVFLRVSRAPFLGQSGLSWRDRSIVEANRVEGRPRQPELGQRLPGGIDSERLCSNASALPAVPAAGLVC